MKRILTSLFTIVLILLSIISYVTFSSDIIEDNNNNKSNFLGRTETITVNTTFPELNTSTLPVLKIESKNINSNETAILFLKDIFKEYENSSILKSKEYEYKYSYNLVRENNTWIKIYRNGGVVSSSDFDDEKFTYNDLSLNKIINISRNYLKKHGNPLNAEIETIHPVSVYKNDELVGYKGVTVEYRFYYNGIKIDGGDKASILINHEGEVVIYYYLKREISNITEHKSIISSKDAYDNLTTEMEGLFQGGEKIEIDNIEICYYTQGMNYIQDEIRPAWKFEKTGSVKFFIDAINGELLTR